MTDKNIFEKANEYIRNTESSLVNLLSAIAPWGAPLAPAMMAYNNMVNKLAFDGTVALIIAAVIEVLGLAAVHTSLTFWQHNRNYRGETEKQQPMWLVIGMFALYLIIVLTVNVALELGKIADVAVFARALLSLLSVPAAVIMAIRAQHTALLSEIRSETAKQEQAHAVETQQNREEQRERDRLEMEERLRMAEIQAQERSRLAEIQAQDKQARRLARIEAKRAALEVSTREGGSSIEVLRGSYQDFVNLLSSNGTHDYTNRELAEKFHVTTRTITDWRAKREKEISEVMQ